MAQELTAESFSSRARNRQNGFSLLEALIVVSISLILTAFAVPMVQSALRSYTLNSATGNVSRIVQQARYVAINQGSDACTLLAGNQFGIDANCNGAFDTTGPAVPIEGRIQIPLGVTVVQTHPDSISTSSMPFPSDPTEFTCGTFAARFNSRGSKTTVCGNPTGVAVTNKLFVTGWGTTNAVTITGTGRAKSWRWDGTTWR